MKGQHNAEHALALAEQLFDQLKHVHGLSSPTRRLIKPLMHAVCAGDESLPDEPFPHASRLSQHERWLMSQALHWSGPNADAEELADELANGHEGPRLIAAARLAALMQVAHGLQQLQPGLRLVRVVEHEHGISLVVLVPSGRLAHAGAALWRCSLWNALMLQPIISIEPVARAATSEFAPLLTPSTPMDKACRLWVLRQIEQLTSRLPLLGFSEDPEYVHESRVAVRRIRSALRVFRCGGCVEATALVQTLKQLDEVLGPVRDSDVFVSFLESFIPQASQSQRLLLQTVLRIERARREIHLRQMVDALEREQTLHMARRLRIELRHGLHAARGEQQKAPVSERCPELLQRALKDVLKSGRRLHELSAAKQHALRIRCKRLRYAAELFGELYPNGLREVIGPMTKIQSLLGHVHDADVHLARIGEDVKHQAAAKQLKKPYRKTERQLAKRRARQLRQADDIWRDFTRRKNSQRLKRVLMTPLGSPMPVVDETHRGQVVVDERLRFAVNSGP